MGAATADVIYGFIAAFGITFIASLLLEYQFWLRLAGGLLLCFLGARTFLAKPGMETIKKTGRVYTGLYTSTFFLTLTNPSTILTMGAVFTAFGLAAAQGSILSAGILVLGVFLGSALWWLFLIGIYSMIKGFINDKQLSWINRTAGIVIAGSGLIALLTLFV